MAYEQFATITVPPSTMFTKLAPMPRPDYYSRTAVSDLPTRPSSYITAPSISKKGLYTNPSKTTSPGPGYPRQKALTKKLKRTGPKQPIAYESSGQVKILHNGVQVKKSRKRKDCQDAPKKKRKKRKSV